MSNQRPSDLACVLKDFDHTQKLAEELYKPIIRKLEKQKVCPSFKDNICGADLGAVLSKYNKGFLFLLCIVNIFSKYALVVPLKDKKDVTITYAFQ